MTNPEIRKRLSDRKSVTMSARCRTATGRMGDVVIIDLTSEGCCLFASAVPLSPGLQVRITPANFQPLAGVVRWASRGYAGIQFEKPLYGPVAEHLQKAFAAIGN